ncbi:MAG: amidohydrolase family protein [Desulfobacterales bacterium]|jgi:predicted TIM-barrel fold metal-dependent hydrolase|nr:amidohydrolase family protein [Desulfobacterales bacterium]
MIIDFHTHIFPKEIRTQRGAYFDGEPEFKLLYDSPKSSLVGADEIIAAMDQNGVDKSVVFGFPWHQSKHFIRHNNYILEAISRYPDRLIGFCCLDPFHQGASAEAARCLAAGLSGIGELAFYQTGFDPETVSRLAPLMALSLENNTPVLIHTNEPVGHMYPGKAPVQLSQIYQMVKAFPQNPIVLAHWGGGIFFYQLMKKEVKDVLANVYVDTAASPFLYDPAVFEIAVRIIGAGKILFGSDFPLLPPARYFKALDPLELTSADRKKICGATAAMLLGLKEEV